MRIHRGIFTRQRDRQFGTANPSHMDCPFWQHMVQTGQSAHSAKLEFDPDGDVHAGGPVWCFHRFGPTRTLLPDGRVICIGGEHEDGGFPDFYIYNDVIVVMPDGTAAIYGYPRDVFPPTDFHTATLFGDCILIVGRLGYKEERGEQTPVYRLSLKKLAITRLVTSGPSPGWLYGHQAKLVDDGRALRVWGGRVLKPKGKGQTPVRYIEAADLVLADLTWRPAAVPEDENRLPWLEDWPEEWQPISDKMTEFYVNELRHQLPLGHPLFAANVRPWATGPREELLVKMLDGTDRVAVIEAEIGLVMLGRHHDLPSPSTVFYDNLHAWLWDPHRDERA